MSGELPLKDRVLSYITETDYVSFAELTNRFGADFSGGDFVIAIEENLLLWVNMTKEACDAIEELRAEGAIICVPSQILSYLIDGRSLSLPIAKRVRAYKKPHWLPVTLRPASALRKKGN